jgi:hypothetical protein
MNEVDHARKTFLAILPKNPNKMHVFWRLQQEKMEDLGWLRFFFI